MKINEVVDNKDRSYQETQYYKRYESGHLYVGVKTSYEGILSYEGFHKYRPKSRKPVDTFLVLHNLTNHLSKEIMDIYIRSGIFTSKDKQQADLFGDTIFRLIPNDGYEAYYNPNVKDFTIDTEYKRQSRAIMYHLIQYESESGKGPQIKHMQNFLRFLEKNADQIDYDNFVESVYVFYLRFASDVEDKGVIGNSDEIVKDVFQKYYDDTINYIKGMEKIEDFENVKTGYEIIIFPFNGFWFV